MKIISAPDYVSMSRKAANLLSAQVILKPDCVLGLATGGTPVGVYRQLIDWYEKGDLDFSKVHTINLDEYIGLPVQHPQSYRSFMNENLFKHINVPIENTHVPNGTAHNMEAECIRYEKLVESLGGVDMQLLGIGNTGHIGFNEPNDCFDTMTHIVTLKEVTIKANARFFDSEADVPQQAITMGIQTIMKAKKIVLVANGENKADILEKALFGPIRPQIPASILQLHSDVTVFADEAALKVIREKHMQTID
ncbi:glucosamine-6-phosphate deaminase [Caproicibacterium amylolyticum]|uniref:Glucosamine-6-phosphate deaminase n=1 Tax=Caproicibacterium amylolyticum TaxID=2766537 RepID=A0A7G9WGH4_9FIRM|nr:glucosamine-6-phosphate deaminase [Caproicibacterium amylolyticum]QNO17786.1 glucosamine-6-phosphate deaminase [Caproicibacterium amylolyticum]